MNVLLARDTCCQIAPQTALPMYNAIATRDGARHSMPLALRTGVKYFCLVNLVGEALYVI